VEQVCADRRECLAAPQGFTSAHNKGDKLASGQSIPNHILQNPTSPLRRRSFPVRTRYPWWTARLKSDARTIDARPLRIAPALNSAGPPMPPLLRITRSCPSLELQDRLDCHYCGGSGDSQVLRPQPSSSPIHSPLWRWGVSPKDWEKKNIQIVLLRSRAGCLVGPTSLPPTAGSQPDSAKRPPIESAGLGGGLARVKMECV
jgi:hypothetical protein